MAERTDNYLIQARQAKKLFLTYDQQELICRCGLKYDETYFYITFLGAPYRLERTTGDLQRLETGSWVDGNSFAEVMTVLDWLCDSRPDRYITGRWINIASQGHYFHRELQEEPEDPDAILFDQNPQGFAWACRALGGEPFPGADVSYAIELVDGLRILVQLWHGDEEFPPRLRFLWDENTTRYIRYETTWYVLGLLVKRLRENMPLQTPRLLLRPWQESDAEALYSYAKDPDVGHPAGWPAHTSVENSRQIIRDVLAVPETYAVCRKEDGQPIGCIGLKQGGQTDMTDRADECELGYWLGKPFLGQGISPEAARELLRHAFEDLGMNAVWCGYYDFNHKSRRVQEKLGFTYRYTTENLYVPLVNEYRTGITNLMTKEDWQRKKNND